MSEFVVYLKEVFEQFGPISARRMFGGHGIYHDDLMFGLVADDVLYLKADNISSPIFEEKGLQQFEFVKQGKTMRMSYYVAPEEIFEDTELASEWATRAFDAALRSKKPKAKTKRKKNK